MSRTTSVKADLHEYSLNKLKKLRNSYPTEIGRNVLTTVVMLTEGNSIKQISDFLALNVITIYTYLNRWNELGMAALEDYRGKTPSNCKMTAEMEYDLLDVVQHKVPNDFDFLGNVWTAKLLSDYLYQNYEIRLSPQCIRDTLHKNNFSFKRAQKKPSKGVKSEQETFKKMIETTFSVENDSDSVLYVMDEAALRTESDNRRTWSPVGVSPVLESNGSHQGVNIIGATEITKNFDTVADVYDAEHTIKSTEIKEFIINLLERNADKKVYLVLDNAKTHNNQVIQELWKENSDRLVLINTPAYSPQLNPQENIWNLLKNKIFTIGSKSSTDSLFEEVNHLYNQFNDDKELISNIVNPRSYYFKSKL